ncbi:MAG: hypothetical protein L0027_00515 [Candidatus Rokubacteria bacterium]|nr:hypothetical protein [Candidatus Rokubacteria bacterium]
MVAVQADPAAIVGRSRETSGEVAEFWARMATSIARVASARPDPADYGSKDEFLAACIPLVLDEGAAESQDQAVAICSSMWDEGVRAPALTALCEAARKALAAGIPIEDRLNAVALGAQLLDLEPYEIEPGRAILVPAALIPQRATTSPGPSPVAEPAGGAPAPNGGDPAAGQAGDRTPATSPPSVDPQRASDPRWDPRDIAVALDYAISRREAKARRDLEALLDRAQGRIK